MKNRLLEQVRVQFITHRTAHISYIDSARLALEGGCRWIQLRMKEADEKEFVATGLVIAAWCKQYGATFILDDHVELVKEVGANGVHLGKNDMPIHQARHILGDSYIIGGTANTFSDIQQHYISGADYIGCGPYRFTTTKKNLSPILGLDGYKRIMQQMRDKHIRLPLVAIGGIAYEDVSPILQTGVTGIALSGSVLTAENPQKEMQRILEHF